MRTDIPGTSHYIELRGPEDLTIGDIDAYNQPVVDAMDEADRAGQSRDEIPMTMSLYFRRRDALLGRLITAWSFEAAPLPYTAASRDRIPISARDVFRDLADPHIAVINGLEGPKASQSPEAPTASGDGSATTSPDTSESDLPDSPPPPSETAGG